jgi:hypothetical protein
MDDLRRAAGGLFAGLGEREKKMQKNEKRGLTMGVRSGIINELSARVTNGQHFIPVFYGKHFLRRRTVRSMNLKKVFKNLKKVLDKRNSV